MLKSKLFQHGRINYNIKYEQFPMVVIDRITGEITRELWHRETVKFFEFPFTFGKSVQSSPCKDVGEYYRS